MLPGILNQLGAESLTHLKRLASNVTGGTGLEAAAEAGEEDDDEVPDLGGDAADDFSAHNADPHDDDTSQAPFWHAQYFHTDF